MDFQYNNNMMNNYNNIPIYNNISQDPQQKFTHKQNIQTYNDYEIDMETGNNNVISEDDLCSSILAKFERLRLDDASTADSDDGDLRSREQLLKELVTQEIRQCEDYQMMDSQEQKDERLNAIMQKLLMRYHLNLMLKSQQLNQRYMYNIMRSQNPLLFQNEQHNNKY